MTHYYNIAILMCTRASTSISLAFVINRLFKNKDIFAKSVFEVDNLQKLQSVRAKFGYPYIRLVIG